LTPSNSSSLKGVVLLILALASLSIMDMLTKKVVTLAPILMVTWVRYMTQASMTTAFILPFAGSRALLTERPWALAIRGFLLMLTTLLAMLSLEFMPVGEFAAIAMSSPLLVTLLASRILKEKPSRLRIALVCAAFFGTLMVVQPSGEDAGWKLVFPFLFVLANTAFQLLTSVLAQSEKSMTTHFYSVWFGAVLSSILLYWGWTPLHGTQLWVELLLMGSIGALGHFMLTMSFEHAPAASLMPYMYAQIAFGMLNGWIFFDHIPDQWAVLGMLLIALCGLLSGFLTIWEGRQTPLKNMS
jgi:drug/metabolite transporter (DMT)-like permease